MASVATCTQYRYYNLFWGRAELRMGLSAAIRSDTSLGRLEGCCPLPLSPNLLS